MLHTWLLTLAITAVAALGVLLGKGFTANLAMAAIGDEDIKIANGSFKKTPMEDQAEQAARDFLRQRDIGNIDRARSLGKFYADSLWSTASEMFAVEDSKMSQQEKHHVILLCSYLINRIIAECSPNSIVAQTVLNAFYTSVEERSETLYRHISDTATFSLYILNERTGGDYRQVGEIFSRQCGYEGNENQVVKGISICENQSEQYREMAETIEFMVG